MPFKNPIFWRELRTSVRDPKVVFLVVGFIALLSLILLFLWPATGIFSLASDSSMQIFSIFLMSNLALIILLVPALTSPSITTERENNSFDLLFTSLLTPGEILRGKLFAAIAMIVLVVVVSMPISAILALSGGIGPMLLLRAYSVILMAALTYGVLSLALSAICRRTFTALIMSYVLVAFLAGATWLPYYLLGRLYSMQVVWKFIRSLSPFDALYSLLFPGRYSSTELSMMTGNPLFTWSVHMIGMAALFAISLFIFVRYVLATPKHGTIYRWMAGVFIALLAFVVVVAISFYNTISNDPNAFNSTPPLTFMIAAVVTGGSLVLLITWMLRLARTGGDKYESHFTDTRTTIKRKLSWPFYLVDPLKRKKAIGRFSNPIFVAEMRSKVFGNPTFTLRSLALCIILSLLVLVLVATQFASNLQQDVVRWAAIVFQLGIVGILAPAISSGSITDEITSRTFLMLRMTPISAVTVVLGKLKAGFLYVSIFLVSSLPVLFSLAYLDYSGQQAMTWMSFWRVGAWVAILILTTLTFITAGFCASAFSRTTSSATAISYTFAATICIVTFAAVIPNAFTPEVKSWVLTLNPTVAALQVTSDEMFRDLNKDLWIHNMMFLAGISLTFIIASSMRVYYIFTRRT